MGNWPLSIPKPQKRDAAVTAVTSLKLWGLQSCGREFVRQISPWLYIVYFLAAGDCSAFVSGCEWM